MTITLAEAKSLLKITSSDEDTSLQKLIDASTALCADAARMTVEEFEALEDAQSYAALIYAIAYQHEHVEDADHKKLSMDLAAVLEGVRKKVF